MKDIAKILFVFTFGLFVCNTTNARQEKQNNGCVRGKAEPVIKKAVYHNTTFVLQPDSISGIETINFDNGDKLIIRNWGCEYYNLTFRFETSRFQDKTTNLYSWFKSVHLLMTEMLSGLDDPIDIMNGLNKFIIQVDNKQSNHKNLKLGEDLDYGQNEIRSFVSVDKIEKLTDRRYAVEITFSTGPL